MTPLRPRPIDRYFVVEAQALYWLVGQALGQPFEQNIQGTLLYDVRDTGQSVAYGARFSVTNAESTFHTDNSFGASVLDYVGLLCVRTAKSGGLSQVISGHSVHHALADQHPDALGVLTRPFHVDRRGGVRAGEAPTLRTPVIVRENGDLIYRYLRYWIETGHQKAAEPLSADQVQALDRLDEVLARPDLRVEFGLTPGQMFFINNRWILHNRTAFQDHDQAAERRHYVRLWSSQAPP
jgi:alpha-ketoglutarate-dependent taurine dioxygenase